MEDMAPSPAPTRETSVVADLLFILSAAKVSITYLVHNMSGLSRVEKERSCSRLAASLRAACYGICSGLLPNAWRSDHAGYICHPKITTP